MGAVLGIAPKWSYNDSNIMTIKCEKININTQMGVGAIQLD